MQTTTSRGFRHVLVATGVASLALSLAAPAALAGPDNGKVWVCHATSSVTNPYELNHVSVNAVGHDDEHVTDSDALAVLDGVKNKSELNSMEKDALDALT